MIKVDETWVKIPNYEGNYKMNSCGQVISLPRKGYMKKREHLMKITLDKDGYKIVTLTLGCVAKHKKVHRLIAEIFIPNPEKKPFVNHKNGIKSDNRIENLEWVTASENSLHSTYVLNNMPPRPKGMPLGRNPKAKPVIQLTMDGVFIERFDCCASAALKVGASHGKLIADAANGKYKTSAGYKWIFEKEYLKQTLCQSATNQS